MTDEPKLTWLRWIDKHKGVAALLGRLPGRSVNGRGARRACCSGRGAGRGAVAARGRTLWRAYGAARTCAGPGRGSCDGPARDAGPGRVRLRRRVLGTRPPAMARNRRGRLPGLLPRRKPGSCAGGNPRGVSGSRGRVIVWSLVCSLAAINTGTVGGAFVVAIAWGTGAIFLE